MFAASFRGGRSSGKDDPSCLETVVTFLGLLGFSIGAIALATFLMAHPAISVPMVIAVAKALKKGDNPLKAGLAAGASAPIVDKIVRWLENF